MGSLFVWGASSGGLGLSRPPKSQRGKTCIKSPTAVEVGGSKIVSVACGDSHTLAVTEFGDVLSFGRNKEGQLGRESSDLIGRVSGLEHEVVVKVECGAQYSVAITAAGRMYEFGLSGHAAQTGSSEQEATTAAGAAPAEELRGARRTDTLLERIVRESTERWLVADDVFEDAETTDDDVHLLARASLSSAEERAATLGMARMDFRRVAVRVPRLATSLSREKVVDASCGYAHALARAASGAAYASGYNDRGQCGLGHRVNLDRFERIKALERVIRLAAGSQHSLAVVECGWLYCWGLGSLGQLGLGRRVTGRLVPVRVPLRDDAGAPVDARVISCAAGANHSVAIDQHGQAYVFGSVEYNQHGVLGDAVVHDYVAAEYFYVPRRVRPVLPSRLAYATCGANFTLAVTNHGALVSWGWPAHGVLGRDHLAAAIDVIGRFDGGPAAKVLAVAAGSRHAAAIVCDGRCEHGHKFRLLMAQPETHDVALAVDSEECSPIGAHVAILAARSQYFRGLLRARKLHSKGPVIFPKNVSSTCVQLTSAMLRSIVIYLYTDRLEAPPHRLRELAEIARTVFFLPSLAKLCTGAHAPSTYSSDLANLVGDGFASDVHLRIPGSPDIHAHRVILQTADYFAARLRFHDSCARGTFPVSDVVELADWGGLDDDAPLGRRQALALLRFIYGGQDTVDTQDPNQLFPLIVAADLVQLSHLVRFCESALVLQLQDDLASATACLEYTDQFTFCTRLRRAATDVLSRGTSLPISH